MRPPTTTWPGVESLFQQVLHGGTSVLDVNPAKLPTALVNRYLELKASGVF